MATGYSFKSKLQFGREAVFGTAVAATHVIEVLEFNLDIAPNTVRDDMMSPTRMSTAALIQTGYVYKGKLRARANYEGLAMLLDWVMGTSTYASAGGADAGPTNGIYTHTFVELPYLNSLTLQSVEGDIPAGQCFKAVGAIATGMRISGDLAQGWVFVEIDIVAQDKTSAQALTAGLNFPTVTPVGMTQMVTASIKDGSSDAAASVGIQGFEVTLATPVVEDDFAAPGGKVGNIWRAGQTSCKWRMTQTFRSADLFDKAKAFADAILQLEFNDTRAPGVRTLKLTSSAVKPLSHGIPTRVGGGRIIATSEYEAQYNATDGGAIKIVNGNTLATVSTAY